MSPNIIESNLRVGQAFAPVNIALCKYWGKRNIQYNLPMTDSLSISLGEYGAKTTVQIIDQNTDQIQLNGQWLDNHHPDALRIIEFLDVLRELNTKLPDMKVNFPELNATFPFHVQIKTDINVPVASGLASSAAGFAALTLALNNLFAWKLDSTKLSIIARLGSGSACRSLWPGFVHWHRGKDPNGLDSFGEPLGIEWKNLRIGLLILSDQPKSISSRAAMLKTQESSFYQAWPKRVEQDLNLIKKAIQTQDFMLLGETTEANAMAMHALMMSAFPPIFYSTEKTIAAYHKIWQLRALGLPVFFTQDAGPHLKLLFLAESTTQLKEEFPELLIIDPFAQFAQFAPSINQSTSYRTAGDEVHEKNDEVVLVDSNNHFLGTENKLKAHQLGLLHRAFSIFIYRHTDHGIEFLLQKRHPNKYHCGGLWSNACCSHPRQHEEILSAAKRRLIEELFLDIPLRDIGAFEYRAVLENGLIEHELDTVLLGEYDENIHDLHQFNTHEIETLTWMTMEKLLQVLEHSPQQFTPWLKPALNKVMEALCKVC